MRASVRTYVSTSDQSVSSALLGHTVAGLPSSLHLCLPCLTLSVCTGHQRMPTDPRWCGYGLGVFLQCHCDLLESVSVKRQNAVRGGVMVNVRAEGG